jgi:hypothetical protein
VSTVTEEAWLLVESESLKNTLKKDIPAILNKAGYRTSQGKEWTYQTLMLEQKKRNILVNKNENRTDHNLEEQDVSFLRIDTDDAWKFVDNQILKGVKKKLIVPMLNLKGFMTRNGKPWTYQTLMLEQKRRRSEQIKKPKVNIKKNQPTVTQSGKEKQFIECLEFAEAQMQYQIIDVLNRSGKRTRKGRSWTFQTLLIELMKHGLDSEHGSQKIHVENWWQQPLNNIEEPTSNKKEKGADLFDMFSEEES